MMNFIQSNNLIREWFICQAIEYSKRTIIISVITILLIGSGIRFLIIDDDMMKMLPEDIDSKITWDAIQDEFGSTEIIFIAFGSKGKSVYFKKTLADLWDLTRVLSSLPSVDEVSNISTLTRIDQVDGFMEINDLQTAEELSEIEISNIKTYLNKNPNLKKQLLSKDEDYFLTIIQPHDRVGLDQFRDQVVSVGDSLLKGYETYYGGTAYVTGSVPQLIRQDIQSLIKAGIFIMISILLINLRSFSAVGMVMMIIITSLISMMGFMGWAYKITGSDKFLFALLNTSMPIILLTIANSDGVHVMTKFFREMRTHKNTQVAISKTMETLLIPIFLTSITTIAAFMTMVSSPLEPLVGYGISISVGIASAWLLSSLLLPAVINLKTWDKNSRAINQKSVLERYMKIIGSFVTNYPKYVFLFGIILVSVGLVGFNKIKVDVNVASFFKPGTEIRDSMDFIDKEMSGTMDLRVRVEGDLKDPNLLQKMDDLQNFLSEKESITVTYSIANIVKQMHRAVMDDSLEYEIIPKEREKVNNLFTMYSMSGNIEDFSSMVDYNYSSALITALSSTISTETVFQYVQNIKNYISENFSEKNKVDITGMIVVIRDLVVLVIQSSVLSILISVILVGIITSIFFKRAAWGFLAVIPLAGAIILNFGLMGHFDITFNHITAILSAIIIGVGVDFAIHFISQFISLSNENSQKQVSQEVIKNVGYPILLDAGSNMGFGALLFSAFIPVQYVGGLMVFAMISTSLGTLTLLASLLELFKNRLVNVKD